MTKFDFSEALPNGKRSFYLKGQAISTLQTSLIHIFDALDSLLTVDLKRQCEAISNSVQALHERASIFPYVLLNARLSDALQQQDAEKAIAALKSFTYQPNKLGTFAKVIPYGSTSLSEQQWRMMDQEIIFHLPQGTYITSPAPDSVLTATHLIDEAIHLIKTAAPAYYEEFDVFISDILVLSSNHVTAGSGFNILGLMYCREGITVEWLAEYIIHELAHQYLYFLTIFDELCSGEGLHEAPMRKDKRPIEGIYHAAFVLARMTHFYKECLKAGTFFSPEFLDLKIQDYQAKFQKGYNTVLEVAKLTDLGKAILINSRPICFGKN